MIHFLVAARKKWSTGPFYPPRHSGSPLVTTIDTVNLNGSAHTRHISVAVANEPALLTVVFGLP